VRVVAINRFFRPDHSATSQLLTDLAHHLARQDHVVTVVAGRRRYDGRGTEGRSVDGEAVPVAAIGGESRRDVVCRPCMPMKQRSSLEVGDHLRLRQGVRIDDLRPVLIGTGVSISQSCDLGDGRRDGSRANVSSSSEPLVIDYAFPLAAFGGRRTAALAGEPHRDRRRVAGCRACPRLRDRQAAWAAVGRPHG